MQVSESASIRECPKCHQPMRWHSSHESKTSAGIMQTTIFHCEQCDRYVAEPIVEPSNVNSPDGA